VSKFKVKYTCKRLPVSGNEGWVPPDGVTWEVFLKEKVKLIAKQEEEKKQGAKPKVFPTAGMEPIDTLNENQ